MDGDEDGFEDRRLTRSRPVAFAAFLLAITSLLLSWWRVTWDRVGEDVRPFRPEPPLTTSWAPWLTGILVALAIVLLFVRIAARSDRHEPAIWRRDLGIAALLMATAVLSALLWPADVPAFWGGRTYRVENVTTTVTETARPVLGWWVALAATALLALARRMAWPLREPPAEPPVQPET